MTVDEILTRYEALWRQAALEDTPQFFGFGTALPNATCAAVIGVTLLGCVASSARLSWICPEDGWSHVDSLWGVFVHLNNAHGWTWDMLANRTRDALAAGGVVV